jgi:hypothetical protein
MEEKQSDAPPTPTPLQLFPGSPGYNRALETQHYCAGGGNRGELELGLIKISFK